MHWPLHNGHEGVQQASVSPRPSKSNPTPTLPSSKDGSILAQSTVVPFPSKAKQAREMAIRRMIPDHSRRTVGFI